MTLKAYFVKFSRTCFKDYAWLAKADLLSNKDYQVLEHIFNTYKLIQSKQSENTYCGLLRLSACYCYISCYKTTFTDDCGRPIYALDALCIGKENVGIVGAVYCIFFSNPQKYIQHDIFSEDEYSGKPVQNYEVDLSTIFENYYYICTEDINRSIFEQIDFNPTFRGFDDSIKDCLVPLKDESFLQSINSLLPVGTISDTSEPHEINFALSAKDNEQKTLRQMRKKHDDVVCSGRKCVLSIFTVKEKLPLWAKSHKFIIKGTFDDDDCEFLFVEKYYTDKAMLKSYLNSIEKDLKNKGFSVVTNKDFYY